MMVVIHHEVIFHPLKPRGPRARTHHTQDHAPKPPVPLQRGSATRPSSSHCIRAVCACIPPRLTQGNCCYCGAATRAGRHQGIDRINSARGYHLRNCRPCCGPCNYMKHTMDLSDFLARCRAIARRFPSFEVPTTPKVQVVASTNLAAPAVTPAPPVLRKRWVARPGGWIKRTWVLA